MRQRLSALLVALTVMMGTVVVASGILTEPAPQATAERTDLRATSAASRDLQREPVPPPESPAPRAELQDPLRIPAQEPPAPVVAPVPGGVSGVDVPHALGGVYELLEGTQEAPPGRSTYRLSIEVEEGLPVEAAEFGDFVMETLNDERSWAKDGAVTFARTDTSPNFRVRLASPATVDRACAPLATNGKWSCGRGGNVMINADRWINGAEAFTAAGGDILMYRQYLITHEMGHLLGHLHASCPGPGQLAPVMVQQSISLDGCEPNGWAHP